MNKNTLFWEYFKEWIALYKEGAIRPITLEKYRLSLKSLIKIAPELKLSQIDKRKYQWLLNEYAKTHERQTVKDWHAHIKAPILDAMDEGYIKVDPTRKPVFKGREPRHKKDKFLSIDELKKLLSVLNLDFGYEPKQSANGRFYTPSLYDWQIYLAARTGVRFSECLGITKKDFNFENKTLSINKTWNYKYNIGGFVETKNKSSIRTILLDDATIATIMPLINRTPDGDKPVFVFTDGKIYNSMINSRMETLCKRANVPIISFHGLRHTHASILLCNGISIASIAKRLGHANTTTTQKTYLHIIKELEAKDNHMIMNVLNEF